ncbi:hypothetical protein OF83DRAFT_1177621, partial [Amylostereum chailletii]
IRRGPSEDERAPTGPVVHAIVQLDTVAFLGRANGDGSDSSKLSPKKPGPDGLKCKLFNSPKKASTSTAASSSSAGPGPSTAALTAARNRPSLHDTEVCCRLAASGSSSNSLLPSTSSGNDSRDEQRTQTGAVKRGATPSQQNSSRKGKEHAHNNNNSDVESEDGSD